VSMPPHVGPALVPGPGWEGFYTPTELTRTSLSGCKTPPTQKRARRQAAGLHSLVGVLGFFCVCTIGFAQSAPEPTPTELPGAEAFVYRDGATPMRLFVVKPAGWKSTDQRAALMFFFGGGWTTGTPASSVFWAKFAAELGMVGIAPDYRTKGRHDVSPLFSVADSRAALRWVEDHAAELGLDPARIVVGGNSAGGHVALWTAIRHAPPGSDEKESPRTKPVALILFSTVSDTSKETGYTPQRFGEQAVALSPVHQLDAKMPPVLAFHGDADKLVPLRQAIALRDKLLVTGNSCELHIVPAGGHNFGTDVPAWQEKSRQLISAFLKTQGLLPGK
jgi:acetyl esterase